MNCCFSCGSSTVDICNGGDVRRLDDVVENPRDAGMMSAETSSAYRNDGNIIFFFVL